MQERKAIFVATETHAKLRVLKAQLGLTFDELLNKFINANELDTLLGPKAKEKVFNAVNKV